MAVCVWFQLSHQGDRAPTQAAPSLPARKVTVYKIIFCKKGKKKLHLKKKFKKKKKQKTTYFIIEKKYFFSPPVLNGKEEKLTICTEMFLLWHRKITKHKVIFHSFYWIFFPSTCSICCVHFSNFMSTWGWGRWVLLSEAHWCMCVCSLTCPWEYFMILKKTFWNGCFSKKIIHGFSFLSLLKSVAGLFYDCRVVIGFFF